MTEILNQNELDALLLAISTGEIETGEHGVPRKKQYKLYDFRRPDKFSKDQIRTLQMMHETFARLSTTMLSAKCRALAEIHVVSVDQLTFEEFLRSIPNPTLMAVIGMDPLPGSAVIEIDPSITFAIIDRLSGGTGTGCELKREHTDIELMLLEGMCIGFIANLRYSWENVIELRPLLQNLETNPQFAQIVPPNDIVMLITLEVKLGGVEGMMNICMPFITLESVIERLSARFWFTGHEKAGDERVAEGMGRASFREYVLYTGAVDNMTPEEMRRLKPGTRIPLRPGSATGKVYEFAGISREECND